MLERRKGKVRCWLAKVFRNLISSRYKAGARCIPWCNAFAERSLSYLVRWSEAHESGKPVPGCVLRVCWTSLPACPAENCQVRWPGFCMLPFRLDEVGHRNSADVLLATNEVRRASRRPKTVENIHTTLVTSISRLCRRVRPLLLRSSALQCGFQPFLHY